MEDPSFRHSHLGDVDSINLDETAINLSQSEEATDHTGLPGTCTAHNPNLNNNRETTQVK